MPQGRKLLVINLYYPPDLASTGQLAGDICSNLVQRGIEVHVVTGQPSYTAAAPAAAAYEVIAGVHVHRVSTGGARGRERMSTRMTGYLSFLWNAWRMAEALARKERPDCILTFHNPPIVGLIGGHLARRHRIPYTYVLYDINPDALVATDWPISGALVGIWKAMNRWIMDRASTIIVLGEGMKRTLMESYGLPANKVRVIPMWARPELEPGDPSENVRQELGVEDSDLLMLDAGNMGVHQPIEPILDAAGMLRDRPVRFLFIGDGLQRERMIKRVETEGLDRVKFLPFQEEKRFVDIVHASDACLVALWPGLERFAVPSRAYTLLSAGRPLITLMAPEADVARLVKDSGCGWNVTNGEEMARLLQQLLTSRDELKERGRRGRGVYENRFRRSLVIEEYAQVVMS